MASVFLGMISPERPQNQKVSFSLEGQPYEDFDPNSAHNLLVAGKRGFYDLLLIQEPVHAYEHSALSQVGSFHATTL